MCKKTIISYDNNQYNFKTISDFKWCVDHGEEFEFEYNDVIYNITYPEGKIHISQAFKEETAMICDTAEEVLEYIIEGKKLREIIKEVIIWNRTIYWYH